MKNPVRTILIAAGTVAIVTVLLFSFRTPSMQKEDRIFPVMGTVARITLYDPDRRNAERAADAAQKAFNDVEKLCSIFRKESEVSRLNESAFEKEFACSPELWYLLKRSEYYWQLSDGAFDVTVRPLMILWGFYRKRSELPKPEEIQQTLKMVGFGKVMLNEEKHSVCFKVKGMSLDLGGIAKGYALDRAAEAVRRTGVRYGVLNLGGNLCCLDAPPAERRGFSVGIRDPLHKGRTSDVFYLKNGCVATSGNYERFVVIGGKQYTHIVDPRTGYPVEGVLSSTVITGKGIDSDALSTSVFIAGESFARKICFMIPETKVMDVRMQYGRVLTVRLSSPTPLLPMDVRMKEWILRTFRSGERK